MILFWRSLSVQVIYYLNGACALTLVLYLMASSLEEPVCSGHILSRWCLCAHLGLLLDGLFSGGACLFRSYIISIVPVLTLVLYLMILFWRSHSLQVIYDLDDGLCSL
jgi:hypothetical protein